ncbi:MAG TPA: twin-arginine translocase TatA/TatE family subunit [Burkholderiales bacterium]
MFEVGFTEILLILGIALLVLGPEKLPGLAEKVGRWTGRARAMARQLRTQAPSSTSMRWCPVLSLRRRTRVPPKTRPPMLRSPPTFR